MVRDNPRLIGARDRNIGSDDVAGGIEGGLICPHINCRFGFIRQPVREEPYNQAVHLQHPAADGQRLRAQVGDRAGIAAQSLKRDKGNGIAAGLVKLQKMHAGLRLALVIDERHCRPAHLAFAHRQQAAQWGQVGERRLDRALGQTGHRSGLRAPGLRQNRPVGLQQQQRPVGFNKKPPRPAQTLVKIVQRDEGRFSIILPPQGGQRANRTGGKRLCTGQIQHKAFWCRSRHQSSFARAGVSVLGFRITSSPVPTRGAPQAENGMVRSRRRGLCPCA